MGTSRIDAESRQPDLGDRVLACFQQACSERRMEVAEHLLVAVEQLSADELGAADPVRHRQLSEAYGEILELARTTDAPR